MEPAIYETREEAEEMLVLVQEKHPKQRCRIRTRFKVGTGEVTGYRIAGNNGYDLMGDWNTKPPKTKPPKTQRRRR